ncbi:MAG TPA: SDR family NAD(P)-dependent oxidoreductase, partial [Myxococcales bacterium]|nr:SDR family NAD(P)-dependent oxidoreductase [Myxococcales bacterium]
MQADPKVALVTGAAQGIGRAIAGALAQAGFHVAAAEVQPEVEAVARALEEQGLRATHACFDVADPRAVRAAVDRLAQGLGRGVGVLV